MGPQASAKPVRSHQAEDPQAKQEQTRDKQDDHDERERSRLPGLAVVEWREKASRYEERRCQP
jgi:hypothetical protein